MSETFKDILLNHMPEGPEYKIMVKKSVFRIIGNSCRNVTPPSADDEIVTIDYELFEREATTRSLVEQVSSKMAKIYTISLYRVTHEEKTGMEQLNLVWTTGTVSTLCNIAKILKEISKGSLQCSDYLIEK